MTALRQANSRPCELLRAALAVRGPPYSLWRILQTTLEYEFVPADRQDARLLEAELRLKVQRFWQSADPDEIRQLTGELLEIDRALCLRSVGVWVGEHLMEFEAL